MLFFFRKVYSEVVTAMPVNGGTYNLILNTTTKKTAGVVACLSILSYLATAIISAFDAVIYLKLLWPAAGLFSSVLKRFFIILKYCSSDIRLITVAIILFFTGVTCMGVKESAAVSLMMFLFHLLVLLVLITGEL